MASPELLIDLGIAAYKCSSEHRKGAKRELEHLVRIAADQHLQVGAITKATGLPTHRVRAIIKKGRAKQ